MMLAMFREETLVCLSRQRQASTRDMPRSRRSGRVPAGGLRKQPQHSKATPATSSALTSAYPSLVQAIARAYCWQNDFVYQFTVVALFPRTTQTPHMRLRYVTTDFRLISIHSGRKVDGDHIIVSYTDDQKVLASMSGEVVPNKID